LREPVLRIRIPVTVTAYSSTPDQTDGTPFLAACGPVRDGILAVSDDLWRILKCGDSVYLEGYGRYVVWDRMHSRWRRRVDVWVPSRSSAYRHGVREAVLVLEHGVGHDTRGIARPRRGPGGSPF